MKLTFIEDIQKSGSSCKEYKGTKMYVDTGNVKVDKIVGMQEYTYQDKPSRANLCVEVGDVLFAKMKDSIKVVLIDETNKDFIYSTGFYAFRDERINPTFLKYFLLSDAFNIQKNNLSQGATMKAINDDGMSKISIDIPDMNEQIKIAKLFDKIFTLLASATNRLSYFDELVKSRFIEMFGDPKTNPNSFDIVSFNECVEYMGDIGSNGANQVVVDHLDMKDEEDYALMVRFLNFTKNDFTDDVKYISKESYEFFKKSQIFGGELIICKIGSAGQNYVMPYLNRPVSLGLNQIMVRINKKTLMPYLYRYINSDYGKQLINGCINGAVTKSITKTELKKIPVMIPPMELQSEFVAFIEQTDKSKFEIQKSLEKLETLKKALMQKYFG